MPASPARLAAFEILLRVENNQSYISELLHSTDVSKLSTRDQALATELTMGAARWQSLLDDYIQRASAVKLTRLDVEVLIAMRLGAYQLLFLSRIPSRAAVFESAELVKAARKRSATSFVNAVLRKISKMTRPSFVASIRGSTEIEALARNAAHPKWLIARWTAHYGFEIAQTICLHNQSVPTTSIHFLDASVEAELADSSVELQPGALLASARRINSGEITQTKTYREGRVTIQDEASQLVGLLVGRGKYVLDCCAAPGNKTAYIANKNPTASLVAVDIHQHRANLLRRLVQQRNVRVIAADARALPFRGGFDRVLADVPCSGTGTLARNPEIKWRLRQTDLGDLQARQISILRSAFMQLTRKGRLIYSTCSLEPEENQAVVEKVVLESQDCTLLDLSTEVRNLQAGGVLCCDKTDSLTSGPYLRTLPGVHPCDGFFAAMLERTR